MHGKCQKLQNYASKVEKTAELCKFQLNYALKLQKTAESCIIQSNNHEIQYSTQLYHKI